MKAVWNGEILAESNDTIIYEGIHYFPPNSINKEFISISDTSTFMASIGCASYYSVNIDGQLNLDSAWSFPNPSVKAQHIKNYIAFWKGVNITHE